MQAKYVTKEAERGVSQSDIAFGLAKLAYRNGSIDDISAYVLSLDSKMQDRSFSHEVHIPSSNRGTLLSERIHSEPILAPHTPAQHKSFEGSTFSPPSHGHSDNAPCTRISGMHQHQHPQNSLLALHLSQGTIRMVTTSCVQAMRRSRPHLPGGSQWHGAVFSWEPVQ